jgi:hypothetical protein
MLLTLLLAIKLLDGEPLFHGPFNQPDPLEVRARMLFVSKGMPAAQARKVLGVDRCLLGGGFGTLNTWITITPTRRDQELFITTTHDHASGTWVLESVELRPIR